MHIKEDARPQRGTWAPGDYWCDCCKCGAKFYGDKRAVTCADCAYNECDTAPTSVYARREAREEAEKHFDDAVRAWLDQCTPATTALLRARALDVYGKSSTERTSDIVLLIHSQRDEKSLAARLLLGARSASNAHGLDINIVLEHVRKVVSQ